MNATNTSGNLFMAPSFCAMTSLNEVKPGASITILLLNGKKVVGNLLDTQYVNGEVRITSMTGSEPQRVPLADVKIIYLPEPRPWVPAKTSSNAAGIDMKPGLVDFVIDFKDGDQVKGRTFGFHTDALGLRFFPSQKPGFFFYVFAPHHAIKGYQIGPKLGKQLVDDAIVSQEAVDDALEEQAAMRKRPIGEYLKSHAVVTTMELERCLRDQPKIPNLRLGEFLVKENLITEAQLNAALEEQARDRSHPLGAILVQQRKLTNRQLQQSLSKKLGVPFVDLERIDMDEAAMMRVPEEVVRKYSVLPLHIFDNKLVVAVDNPLDRTILDEIRFAANMQVVPVIAPPEMIVQAIENRYADLSAREIELEAQIEATTDLEEKRETEDAVSHNQIVKLANRIVADAYAKGASDIHIEPYPGHQKTVIRFRKDGSLVTHFSVPSSMRRALVSRFKIMANLNVAERRLPQDGKINFRRFSKLNIELRVATIPTAGGEEDVVLRILASGKPKPMQNLAFSRNNLACIRSIIKNPYGLFLVCGPTGSGKTTTLHSLLAHLNTDDRKIWTIEDPVEITQKGLRQVQLQTEIGLGFVTAMRAFLRADPDVIMVGEMRDAETMETAIEASLTGHLVLSTMHTNSATDSITRLVESGMDPYNFADALLGVLAQRLAKRICRECSEKYESGTDELVRLAEEYCHDFQLVSADQLSKMPKPEAVMEQWRNEFGENGAIHLLRAVGCRACDDTGYSGRIGLHEVMLVSAPIRQAIAHGAHASNLLEISVSEGMRTLRQDGIEKILQGHTDLKQVHRACAR